MDGLPSLYKINEIFLFYLKNGKFFNEIVRGKMEIFAYIIRNNTVFENTRKYWMRPAPPWYDLSSSTYHRIDIFQL